MTETEIKKQIVDFLKAHNFKVYRMQSGFIKKNFQLNEPGTPDLFCVGQNQSFWVEVKTPTGQLRPSQVKVIAELEAMGQQVVIARSIDDLIERNK